jgi:hypothetical protein
VPRKPTTSFLLLAFLACKGGSTDAPEPDAVPEGFCSEAIPCEDPALPFCDEAGAFPDSQNTPNTCIAQPPTPDCSDTISCPTDEAPVCNSIGECVECLNFSHCNTTNPLCALSTYTCGPCRLGAKGNSVCEAIDSFQPFCAETGSCVECLTNDACTIITAPICDVSEFRCRGCTSTNECDAGTCNTLTGVCETN